VALQQSRSVGAYGGIKRDYCSGIWTVYGQSDFRSGCALGSAMQKINLAAYLAYKAVRQNQILATQLAHGALAAELRSGCALGSAMLRWNLTAHLEVNAVRQIWSTRSSRVWIWLRTYMYGAANQDLDAYFVYNAVRQNRVLAAYWEVQSIDTRISSGCALGSAMLQWNLIACSVHNAVRRIWSMMSSRVRFWLRT